MVKPRVFVSSTYYDLKHIREALNIFIDSLGFEPVIAENGNITHIPGQYVDMSCYLEVKECHLLVLIIGGRYGSRSSKTDNLDDSENDGDYESVVVKEYQAADDKGIPTYVFIDRNVLSEYKTFKENQDVPKFNCHYVDNKNVFKFIDKIYSLNKNWIREFDKSEDITKQLKNQWAGLFAKYLMNIQADEQLKTISGQTEEISKVIETLKTYTESILKSVNADEYGNVSDKTEKKDIENRLELFYLPAQTAIKVADRFMNDSRNSDVLNEICKHKRGYEHLSMTPFERASIYVAEELKQIARYRFRAKEDTRKAFEKYVYEEENEENYFELSELINKDVENYYNSLNNT